MVKPDIQSPRDVGPSVVTYFLNDPFQGKCRAGPGLQDQQNWVLRLSLESKGAGATRLHIFLGEPQERPPCPATITALLGHAPPRELRAWHDSFIVCFPPSLGLLHKVSGQNPQGHPGALTGALGIC